MRPLLAFVLSAVFAAPVLGQEPYAPTALTAADYARADSLLGFRTMLLVSGGEVEAEWLSDDRFWYRNRVSGGTEFVLVDPARGTRERMFDHERLAAALSAAADTTYQAFQLPFRALDLTADGRSLTIAHRNRRFTCDVVEYRCVGEAVPPDAAPPHSVTSPDGRRAAYVKDWNLWVRDLASDEETQLTADGVESFGYATNNAGWTKSDEPVLLWSPDSRRIATFQHDARGVGDMTLVATNVGRPRVERWPYPFPGDSLIFRIERVIVNLDAPGGPRLVRLRMAPDQHRSTVCDHVFCNGEWADVAWTPDGGRLAFVSSSRDHKSATLRIADAETGEVRDVLNETVDTFYESGNDAFNWRVLPESNEVIWYSQRDDWGHLYLYDLATGQLEHQITKGAWNVDRVLRVDPASRTVWFVANGREPGNPYFQYLYRIGLDGTNLQVLTPDSANHGITMSPSGRYFVDNRSTPTQPWISEVRDDTGARVLDLEATDISRLEAIGWQPPIPFSVKARDGTTDLYGILYRPTRFDPSKKYPIVNSIYPGPQSGSVGTWGFTLNTPQSMAELGFVVVELDAMGTPARSKSFHEAYYGDMGDNGLPDQITGMRQLAERYPWIDIERVGIYGHSGGGYASADAILRYPSFFDVAVASSGNHDNRNYEDDWGEKWQGLLESDPDGTTNYDNQANQLLAGNLKGKLLLAHGGMDSNVPPSNTLLLVEALQAANKDFDFLLFPNARHGYGASSLYWARVRWDYFVRNLLGAEPPLEYRIAPPAAMGN